MANNIENNAMNLEEDSSKDIKKRKYNKKKPLIMDTYIDVGRDLHITSDIIMLAYKNIDTINLWINYRIISDILNHYSVASFNIKFIFNSIFKYEIEGLSNNDLLVFFLINYNLLEIHYPSLEDDLCKNINKLL